MAMEPELLVVDVRLDLELPNNRCSSSSDRVNMMMMAVAVAVAVVVTRE
jgi:hypothetical protein